MFKIMVVAFLVANGTMQSAPRTVTYAAPFASKEVCDAHLNGPDFAVELAELAATLNAQYRALNPAEDVTLEVKLGAACAPLSGSNI